MDITFILTIATLVLGAMGVVATLVAPRLSRSAKIYAEVEGVSPIRRDSPSSSLEITVSHKGAVVNRPIYLVQATVENTGSRDVVEKHFLEPLSFKLPQTFEVLSVEAEAANGVRPEAEHSPQSIDIKWLMLKPREKIEIKAIVSSEQDSRPDDIRRQITPEVRLIDVQTGRGFWKSNPWLASGLALYLIMAVPMAVIGAFSIFPVRNDLIVSQMDGHTVSLEVSDNRLRVCQVFQHRVVFSKCEGMDGARAEPLIQNAQPGSGFTGIRPALFWFGVLLPVIYGAMGAFLGAMRRTRRLVRMLARFDRRE